MNVELHDNIPRCSGRIEPFLFDPRTGEKIWLPNRKNVVAYSAADLMARTQAGDETYLPRNIGFIYGTDYSPLLDDPDALPVETRRQHDWARIASDVAAIGGNMLVASLAQAPTVGLDGSSALYTANAVTYSAHTGLLLEYAFDTSGSTYAQTLDALEGDYAQSVYFYHAVLLNRWESGGQVTYTPFSRAAFGTAPFDPKPTNLEMAVFWTLTFK
jgi:hypothetical protein